MKSNFATARHDPALVLAQRSQDLDSTQFAYKLGGTDSYGIDTAFPEQLDIDEKAMCVTIPFADGNARDGVGDLLEVSGIRTYRHQKNPIVLFDHAKQVALPIGLAEDPQTRSYTVYIDPLARTASAKVYFYQGGGPASLASQEEGYDHALFCEQLFDLMAKRYVRAGSIGYQILKGYPLPPDPETGAQKGMHLLETLMLELSAVVLPANGDTVRKALSLPSVCGKPLSPWLVKSLTPYAGPTKCQVGYEGKSADRIVADLRKVCDSFRDIEGVGPNYQRLYWDPTGKRVFWESFDGDDPDAVEEVHRRLGKVNGVREVLGEPESGPPKDAEWMRLWDRNQSDHKSYFDNCPRVAASHCKPKGEGSESKLKPITEPVQPQGKPEPSVHKDRKAPVHEDVFDSQERADIHQEVLKRRGDHVVNVVNEGNRWTVFWKPRMKSLRAKWQTKNQAGPEQGTKGNKAMPETENKEPKADKKPADPEAGHETEQAEEPFGAQTLRQVHADHRLLLEDYDKLHQLQDHPKIKKFLEKRLGEITKAMDDMEAIHGESYGHLPPLEGSEAVPADSGQEEADKPEEAVEAMHKELAKDPAREKALRAHYRKAMDQEGKPGDEEFQKKPGKQGQDPADGHKPGDEESQEKPGHDGTEEDTAGEHEPGDEAELEEHEKGYMKSAHDFLGSIGGGSDWGDEQRMEAYHHHKTLLGMAGSQEPTEEGKVAHAKALPSSKIDPAKARKILHDGEANGKPLTDKQRGMFGAAAGKKAHEGMPAMEDVDNQEGVQHPPAYDLEHGPRWVAKGASDYFKELSQAQSLSDEHREKAGYWHKMMAGHVGCKGDYAEADASVREMGPMKSIVAAQTQQIEMLSKKLAAIGMV